MTQINGVVGTVTAIGGVTTAWTVTTNINSSAFTAWSSGGTASTVGAGNTVVSIPFGQLLTLQSANVPLLFAFPCLSGIVVSGVSTGGVFAIAYS
jgi:hypothetical protein